MTAKTPENRNKTAKNLKSRPVEGQDDRFCNFSKLQPLLAKSLENKGFLS
jgi:hypothetical protein